jgi:hypothetical protein
LKKFDHMIPLLLSQQAELDGAAMYNKLAALTENGDAQRVFREIAADEAAHALLIQSITGDTKNATDFFTAPLTVVYNAVGLDVTYLIIAIGEAIGAVYYKFPTRPYPELHEISHTELTHAKRIAGLLLADILANVDFSQIISTLLASIDPSAASGAYGSGEQSTQGNNA